MQTTIRIIEILPEESGVSARGKAWRRKTFVGQTSDQYPATIAFNVMGDRIDKLPALAVGYSYAVDFDIDSHSYAGRWYTSCVAWRVTAVPAR